MAQRITLFGSHSTTCRPNRKRATSVTCLAAKKVNQCFFAPKYRQIVLYYSTNSPIDLIAQAPASSPPQLLSRCYPQQQGFKILQLLKELCCRVEELKLLSQIEKSGLLSTLEDNGLTLKRIEQLGLLSKAESLGLLSAASDKCASNLVRVLHRQTSMDCCAFWQGHN